MWYLCYCKKCNRFWYNDQGWPKFLYPDEVIMFINARKPQGRFTACPMCREGSCSPNAKESTSISLPTS